MGEVGADPTTSEENGFTDRRRCRLATLPYGTPQGFEPIPLVLETNVLPIKLSHEVDATKLMIDAAPLLFR